MDVQIVISARAKVALALIEEKYPDLNFDDESDGYETYYVGDSSDEVWFRAKEETGKENPSNEEQDAAEWFSREDAIECCGFCEALGAETLMGGNGGWAQSMLRQTDFRSYCGDTSGFYADAAIYQRGTKAARKARREYKKPKP